jgi:hypothetical protein
VRAWDRGLGSNRPPLVIALPTLETSLAGVPFQTPIGNAYRHDPALRILESGQVLEAMASSLVSFSMTRGWSSLAPRRVLLRTGTPSRRAHLLQYEGDLLYAGREWHRIIPSSLQIQPLTDGPLPSDLDFDHYAASSCFGLVAWNQGGPLHRVHLNLSSTVPANGGSAPDGQR